MASVNKIVTAGFSGAVGALVTAEAINAIDYTGAGSGLVDLMPLLVAAGAVMTAINYF